MSKVEKSKASVALAMSLPGPYQSPMDNSNSIAIEMALINKTLSNASCKEKYKEEGFW